MKGSRLDHFVVGLLISMTGVVAFADTSATNLSGIETQQEPSAWKTSLTIGKSHSLYDTNSGNELSSVDYSLATSYSINQDWGVSALLEASDDLKAQEFDYGRGLVSLTKKTGFGAFGDRAKLIPGMTISLPVSKATRYTSLLFGTGLSLRLAANPDYLFSKKMSVAAIVTATRNFHEFEENKNGKINSKFTSGQTLETGWAFTDALSLTVSLTHFDTLSYQGVARDYLAHSQELGWAINETLGLTLGHAWGAPYVLSRKADGQTINLELTDEQNSVVYGQASLTF